MSSAVDLENVWSPGYIFLSFVISCLGSATSLQMMKLRKSGFGWRNHVFLLFGALALGGVGIWCMHFIGMVALTLHRADTGDTVDIGYDPGLTVGSLVVSVAVVAVGFYLSGDQVLGGRWLRARIVATGVIGGSGVAAMHYMGMLAMMVSSASVTWNGGIIFASIIIGIAVVTLALSIFFHPFFRSYWQRSNLLLVATSSIMGLGVIAMHYTGMQAASWTYDAAVPYVEPSNYLTTTTLLAIILPLACVSCIVLIVVQLLLYRQRRSLLSDLLQTQALTLLAIVIDPSGKRLLCEGSVLAPPSVKIADSYYSDRASFDRLNVDFLRMLKASFSWPSAQRYLQHLQQLRDKRQMSAAALQLHTKFLTAADTLAAKLSLPLTAMGVLFWSPLNNLLCLAVDARHFASSPALSALDFSSLHFVEFSRVNSVFTKRLPAGLTVERLVESLAEYRHRVSASFFIDQSEEQLNELLRNVASDLLGGGDALVLPPKMLSPAPIRPPFASPNALLPFSGSVPSTSSRDGKLAVQPRRRSLSSGVSLPNGTGGGDNGAAALDGGYATQEQYVKSWRGTLGRFVRTIHHLETLVRSKHNWKAVRLDPMVKAAIEEQIVDTAGDKNGDGDKPGNGEQNRDRDRDSRSDPVPIPHAVPQPAPLNPLSPGSSGSGQQLPQPGVSVNSPPSQRSDSGGNGSSVRAQLYVGLYLAQAFANRTIHILVPGDCYNFVPTVTALRSSDYSPLLSWMDALERFAALPVNAHKKINLVSDAAVLLRLLTDSTMLLQPQPSAVQPQQQSSPLQPHREALPEPLTGGRQPHSGRFGHSMDKTGIGSMSATENPFAGEQFRSPRTITLVRQFLLACQHLGKLLGTARDLTAHSLRARHVVHISPRVHVLLFVQTRLSSSAQSVLQDYAAFPHLSLPLPLFEIFHFAKNPRLAGSLWTRSVLERSRDRSNLAMAPLSAVDNNGGSLNRSALATGGDGGAGAGGSGGFGAAGEEQLLMDEWFHEEKDEADIVAGTSAAVLASVGAATIAPPSIPGLHVGRKRSTLPYPSRDSRAGTPPVNQFHLPHATAATITMPASALPPTQQSVQSTTPHTIRVFSEKGSPQFKRQTLDRERKSEVEGKEDMRHPLIAQQQNFLSSDSSVAITVSTPPENSPDSAAFPVSNSIASRYLMHTAKVTPLDPIPGSSPGFIYRTIEMKEEEKEIGAEVEVTGPLRA